MGKQGVKQGAVSMSETEQRSKSGMWKKGQSWVRAVLSGKAWHGQARHTEQYFAMSKLRESAYIVYEWLGECGAGATQIKIWEKESGVVSAGSCNPRHPCLKAAMNSGLPHNSWRFGVFCLLQLSSTGVNILIFSFLDDTLHFSSSNSTSLSKIFVFIYVSVMMHVCRYIHQVTWLFLSSYFNFIDFFF